MAKKIVGEKLGKTQPQQESTKIETQKIAVDVLVHILPGRKVATPFEEVVQRELDHKLITVDAAMRQLRKIERKVLNCHYFKGMTVAKCAKHFNVTIERIKEILAKALVHLRELVNTKELVELL